ncbi:hypothetical protein C5F50_03840 [Nitrosopumilus ureiphilus]|uniref:Uncharacterized protein n=1 Tax=Nitrosopumilus ureiphilus TaxID=1470067 RepID=A0A7D5RAB5_9ARCH|nr:hypothetical protein C5F50_03840 [Nitrosopumilus ureiphilus]
MISQSINCIATRQKRLRTRFTIKIPKQELLGALKKDINNLVFRITDRFPDSSLTEDPDLI